MSAAKADFCNSMKAILVDAKQEFRNLRGNFIFEMGEFEGVKKIGRLNNCYTESGDGVATYWCDFCDLPDDAVSAAEELDSLDSALKACLGDTIFLKYRENRAIHYMYTITDDEIKLRYVRIVPRKTTKPIRYCVKLEVSSLDMMPR